VFNFEDALGVLTTLTVEDIEEMFALTDVAQGRQLLRGGQVQERELTSDVAYGDGIEAVVVDGSRSYLVGAFAMENEIGLICECPRNGDCEHGAALLLAWLDAPASFTATGLSPDAPRNVGEILNLLANNPWLREMLADEVPGFEQFEEMLDAGSLDISELAGMTVDQLQALAATQARAIQIGVDSDAADQALRQRLDVLTVAELRSIGRRHNFKLKGTRKADIVDQVAEGLCGVAGQPDFLAGLTHDEHELLRALNTLFGVRELLNWNEMQRAGAQPGRKDDAKALRKVLDGLCEYGLLFRAQPYRGHEQYHWLPHLAAVRLPVVKPAVGTYTERRFSRLSTPEEAPAVPAALALLVAFAEQHPLRLRKPRPRHAQARYYHWLGEWDHDPAEIDRLLQRHYGYLHPGRDVALTVPPAQPLVTDEDLDRFAQWLGGEREFASWLVLLAVAAGILAESPDGKTPLIVQREHWEMWYRWSPETQLRTLFDMWCQRTTGLTELGLAQHRESSLRVQRTVSFNRQFTPTDLAREFLRARGFVTRLLQELPANVWHDWFSFAEAAQRINPAFLHRYFGTDAWGFVVKGDKRLNPSDPGDWDRGYRPVLGAFFEGPLRWLDVVEPGYRGSNLAAFRLTPTGAWLLRGEGRPTSRVPTETDTAPVAWLDDHTFRALPGPDAANVLTLAGTLAKPTRRAFVYELSDEGIQQAFARGIEPAAIVETFRGAGARLPEATSRRIEDLWSRFGHIHLYEKLTVLELADDLALRELLANTDLRQHVIHQFSPRLVVVEDSAVDALVEELIKKGYTPKVVD
jgi:hypothetical protein